MVIKRKITNKERCGNRGKKKRYSVWRSEYNQKWEKINESIVRTICKDHNLQVEDWISEEKRNTWEHTLDRLTAAGHKPLSKSIRDHCVLEGVSCYQFILNQMWLKGKI